MRVLPDKSQCCRNCVLSGKSCSRLNLNERVFFVVLWKIHVWHCNGGARQTDGHVCNHLLWPWKLLQMNTTLVRVGQFNAHAADENGNLGNYPKMKTEQCHWSRSAWSGGFLAQNTMAFKKFSDKIEMQKWRRRQQGKLCTKLSPIEKKSNFVREHTRTHLIFDKILNSRVQ